MESRRTNLLACPRGVTREGVAIRLSRNGGKWPNGEVRLYGARAPLTTPFAVVCLLPVTVCISSFIRQRHDEARIMRAFNVALLSRQHPALALTALCLLLSTSLEALCTYPYPELASESLCWAILYVLTSLSCRRWDCRRYGERPPEEDGTVTAENDKFGLLFAGNEDAQSTRKKPTEVELLLAGAIVISSACRQLAEVNWTLVSSRPVHLMSCEIDINI